MDFKTIAAKWQKKWEEAKAFEANPVPGKKKYFVTFPYPYVNGLPHVGHLYTMMKVEAVARYKRLKGFNVIFPQGWHCTGSPIVDAANRVKEGDPKQIQILKEVYIPDKEVERFKEAEYWIKYFPPEYKRDVQSLGMSIDWRREFITTSLNPYYDKFIRWQFNLLKEKGYVIKGKFPVVWDPKSNTPVPDHNRISGEGETPQEFTLLKFKLGEEYVIAATLRPETVHGQTNLWVGPEIKYVKAKVNGEVWIVSRECTVKLREQDRAVEILSEITGKELIGKKAVAPMIQKEVLILPSNFCKPDKGTGIVTSVPSDAPDDYMGLKDLQHDTALCQKFGLDLKEIEAIQPIAIIKSSDLGDMAAKTICEEMKIKTQNEREKLEEAKKIIYKKGFYEGTMLIGKYKGEPVQKAKDKVKADLLKSKEAELFYELTGKVVARSLAEAIVKIVDDQWFVDYNNAEWKKLAHEALDNLSLYPEKARQQFDYVIDWLHEWACTREGGLGTRLPWDEKWLIESLSDSTIYMSFYTINYLLKQIPIEQVDDALFDYILLGKASASIKADRKLADQMKAEFEYWYPVDYRNSGKDLIQNHLTFYMFNHAAIFKKDKWPKGIGVNGWVTVDGQKMSKSLGNFIPVRKIVTEFGADAGRITILSGGEGLDDPNWDSEMARTIHGKLESVFPLIDEYYGKGRTSTAGIDEWFEAELDRIVIKAQEAMDQTLVRSTIQLVWFDLQRAMKWYLRRTSNDPQKDLLSKALEAQVIMLSPFTPHLCEEAWEKMGKKGFVSLAEWPESKAVDETATLGEKLIESAMTDLQQVFKLAKVDKAKKISLFISQDWKYDLYALVSAELEKTRNTGEVLKAVMQGELKKYGQDITKMVPKLMNGLPAYASKEKELAWFIDAKAFLEKEYDCTVSVEDADKSTHPKAKQASPGKPAILVE